MLINRSYWRFLAWAWTRQMATGMIDSIKLTEKPIIQGNSQTACGCHCDVCRPTVAPPAAARKRINRRTSATIRPRDVWLVGSCEAALGHLLDDTAAEASA